MNARNSLTSNVRSVYGFVTSSLLAVQSCINLASISPLDWNGIKWQHQQSAKFWKRPTLETSWNNRSFLVEVGCVAWFEPVFHKFHQFKLAVFTKSSDKMPFIIGSTPIPQDASQKPRITTFFSRESKQLICNSHWGPGFLIPSNPQTLEKHLGGFGSFGQIGVRVHWWMFWCHLRFANKSGLPEYQTYWKWKC